MRIHFRLFLVPLGLGILPLAGCGDGTPAHVTDCNVSKKTFAQIDADYNKKLCTFSSCHDAASKKGNLDLQTDAHAALVNVLADNAAAKAEGIKRVVPSDDKSSFLIKKLTLPTPNDVKYGQLMPNGQRLQDTEIDEYICWIRRGAPKD